MAYAEFRFIKALLTAQAGTPVTEEAYVYLPGVHGGDAIASQLGVEYFAVKLKLTEMGASQALPIGDLSENEQKLLELAITDLRANIATGLGFMDI
jgi:malate dehydrogenase